MAQTGAPRQPHPDRQIPPHNIEAEQAVLGGILLRPDALYDVLDLVRDTDFYLPAHGHIFAACCAMFQQGVPIDLATLADTLKRESRLEAAGGAAYLAELLQNTISASNAVYFARQVQEAAMARQLITAGAEIIASCYDRSRDIREVMDASAQAVFAVSQRAAGEAFKDSGQLAEEFINTLTERINRGCALPGIRTGYFGLDKKTNGLQPTDLIILAARPSVGKTAFALNLAMRAAIHGGVPTLIYSLEMSMQQLIMRMVCAWGKVEMSKVRSLNGLNDEDFQSLHRMVDIFKNAPLYIDDTPSLSPQKIRARTRKLKAEKGIGLVIIDYLQLMESPQYKNMSRVLEISDISRNLKAMAKELDVAVVALSQLNRKIEERKGQDKRPLLSDLRDSGAIEQDADLILFVHREGKILTAYGESPAGPDQNGECMEVVSVGEEAEIIIGKHRNGETGSVPLVYLPKYTAFENLG